MQYNNLYRYGSWVYGTNNPNSDEDFIAIGDVGDEEYVIEDGNKSIHYYNKSTFQKHIDNHKIYALECLFLPNEHKLAEEFKFTFTLDNKKLRNYISEKSSNSYVKCKKKFEVEKDRDYYVGKKSLFHSIRMIDFAIQIASNNRIENYKSCNSIYEEIMTDPSLDWEHYHAIYKPIFNQYMTRFRELCPKL
jgi:hypothetical protein